MEPLAVAHPRQRRTDTLPPRQSTSSPPADEGAPRTLCPEEERLVVFCCTLASAQKAELLDQVAPERAIALKAAAERFCLLERGARLASFSRLFSPAARHDAVLRLTHQLESEPAWLAALVCRCVPPEVREKLLASPLVREAWRDRLTPRPAALNHARRFAARMLAD